MIHINKQKLLNKQKKSKAPTGKKTDLTLSRLSRWQTKRATRAGTEQPAGQGHHTLNSHRASRWVWHILTPWRHQSPMEQSGCRTLCSTSHGLGIQDTPSPQPVCSTLIPSEEINPDPLSHWPWK